MNDAYRFRGQREDEDVLMVIKQNAWVFAKTAFYILILLNLLVFAFILFGASGVFSYLLVIFVIAGGFLVGTKWYIWTNSLYLLTNQRIIKITQENLFHRLISEIDLSLVQDISNEMKGPIQMFLNFGTIHIQTSTSMKALDLINVTDPYDVQQEIVKAHKLMKNDFSGKMEFRDNFGK